MRHADHRKRSRLQRHKRLLLIALAVNITLALVWGPVFIALTILGPAAHLSSQVKWVAIISYYANMMGNVSTGAALLASVKADAAHDTALDAVAVRQAPADERGVGVTTTHDGGRW